MWWPAGRAEPGAEVLLCEGEPDALAALSALNGIPVAVAALPGTGIPAERITGELAHAERVYLAMDGDDAGKKAADAIARALQTFTELRVLRVGDGEDLASRLYREDDREGWLRAALEQAKPAPKLRLKAETGGYRSKAADRTRDLLARGIDPDKLELDELLERIVDYIETYVVLPMIERGEERYERAVADLLALWIDARLDLLRLVGDAVFAGHERGARVGEVACCMEVLASISRRAWLAVNPSPAVLYRKIDRDQPTLFLDELDNFDLAEKRDAVAVLNAGYKPGAKVPRCSESGELEEFCGYCAKAYAAIDVRQMPPALLSRSITIRMEPKRAGDPVESYIAPDAGPRAEELRECCRAWAERHVDELKGRRPDLVGLTNRRAEVWWPLLVARRARRRRVAGPSSRGCPRVRRRRRRDRPPGRPGPAAHGHRRRLRRLDGDLHRRSARLPEQPRRESPGAIVAAARVSTPAGSRRCCGPSRSGRGRSGSATRPRRATTSTSSRTRSAGTCRPPLYPSQASHPSQPHR